MLFSQITLLDYSRPLARRLETRKSCGPYQWQPSDPNSGRGFYQDRDGLFCDPRGSTIDLRLDYAVTHIPTHRSYRLPMSYHASGDDSLTPIIARLPHSRGFLAGWTMGRGMCASLDATIYRAAEDAALAAYDIAEHAAEQDRECDTDWQCENCGETLQDGSGTCITCGTASDDPNPIKTSYENGECPDCGEPIPDNIAEGEACKNCGHVFCTPREND